MELVKLLHIHRYSVEFFFQIKVLQEYWVLAESRIPLKPVLVGVRIVALSIVSHEETQLNQVSCFLILEVLSILKDLFFKFI